MTATEVIVGVLSSDFDWWDHQTLAARILDDLKAAGCAVVELPEPNSTRYEGDEHEPADRLGWWQDGSLFGVTQWGNPGEVQLAYDGEPFEPLIVNEARFIAAALLAAADAAEVTR